jgi:hypothetical protein
VRKAGEDLRRNRSNLFTSFGYALTRSLYVHGGALLQKTHGGLTVARVLAQSSARAKGHKAIAFSRCGTGT